MEERTCIDNNRMPMERNSMDRRHRTTREITTTLMIKKTILQTIVSLTTTLSPSTTQKDITTLTVRHHITLRMTLTKVKSNNMKEDMENLSSKVNLTIRPNPTLNKTILNILMASLEKSCRSTTTTTNECYHSFYQCL
jgi:hypothetical protein